MEQAVGAQPIAHLVGEAGQFDAVGTHDADAPKLKPPPTDRGSFLPSLSAVKALSADKVGVSESSAVATQAGETRRPMMRSPASVWSPIDPRGFIRQALPDRQQQARHDVDLAVRKFRHLGELSLPTRGRKFRRSASRHWVCGIAASGKAGCSIGRIRPDTPVSTWPSSSITLGAGTCTAARPDCAFTSRTARLSGKPIQRLVQRNRAIALARCVIVSSRGFRGCAGGGCRSSGGP